MEVNGKIQFGNHFVNAFMNSVHIFVAFASAFVVGLVGILDYICFMYRIMNAYTNKHTVYSIFFLVLQTILFDGLFL